MLIDSNQIIYNAGKMIFLISYNLLSILNITTTVSIVLFISLYLNDYYSSVSTKNIINDFIIIYIITGLIVSAFYIIFSYQKSKFLSKNY